MAEAKNGDKLKIHYTGKLEDGSTFDTSVGGEPLEFTLGEGRLIPGFENGVVGMSPGETRTVTISPEDGYGEHRLELMLTVPVDEMPDDIQPAIGDKLQLEQDGDSFVVTVTGVTDENVTLDANHPLAGQDLTFEIELVEIL